MGWTQCLLLCLYKRILPLPLTSPLVLLLLLLLHASYVRVNVVQRRSCPWTTMNLSLLTCELRRGQVEVFAILKLQPRPSIVANGMDDPTLRKQTCVRVLICRLETAFNSNLAATKLVGVWSSSVSFLRLVPVPQMLIVTLEEL